MSPLFRLMAASTPLLILAACMPTEESSSIRTRVREEGPVQAYAALTNFPANTGCLRFTSTPSPAAADGKYYEQLIPVVPGTQAKVALKGLPFGAPLTIMAEAFAEQCPDVGDKSLATWLNESPVSATMNYGTYAFSLYFNMRPIGGATTNIDFTYFTMAPLSQGFGSGVINQPTEAVTRKFTIINVGPNATGAVAASITGPQASSFQIVSTTCAAALAGGNSCTVELRCVPKARNALNATLEVTGTPGGTVKAALTGTGLYPASLSLSNSELNFGIVLQGQASPWQTMSLANNGDFASGAPAIAIAANLPEGSQNQMEMGANNCTAPVNPGQSCTFQIRFAPKAPNPAGFTNSHLTFTANPGGNGGGTNLVGTALFNPVLTITPATFTFPANAASTPIVQAFTVKNVSGVTLPGTSAVLGGTHGGTDFAFAGNTCNQTLAAGASCTVSISAVPIQPGLRTGSITVNGLGLPGFPVSITATFGITAPALLVPTPATLNFGSLGGAAPPKGMIVKVANNSQVNLPAIAFNADASGVFKVTANGCNSMRAPGSSCDVGVSFDPPTVAAATNYAFSLVGTSNAANKVTIPLTGTGTP